MDTKLFSKLSPAQFVWLGLILFSVMYAWFYPPIYGISDEADYFDFAFRLKEGTIFFDPMLAHRVYFNGHRYVDVYPPGMPLLLLPFTFFHWKALFLANLLLHLAGSWFFYRLLRKLQINPHFMWLYLFYPSFVLYARTLMSDMASASLFTIGLYYYVAGKRRDLLLAGLIWGFMCLVRYPNALLVVAVLAVAFVRAAAEHRTRQPRSKEPWWILIGLAPFAVAGIVYDLVALGQPLPRVDLFGEFARAYFVTNFLYYISALLCIYPGMLFAPLAYKWVLKAESVTAILCLLFFYSFWGALGISEPAGPGQSATPQAGGLGEVLVLSEALIVGLRFLLPLIPFFLLSYGGLLSPWLTRASRIGRFGLAGACALLVVGTLSIHWKHDGFLEKQNWYRALIHQFTSPAALIVCNEEMLELFQQEWGIRRHLLFYQPGVYDLVEETLQKDSAVYLAVLTKEHRPDLHEIDLAIKENFLRRYGHTLIKEVHDPYHLVIYRLHENRLVS